MQALKNYLRRTSGIVRLFIGVGLSWFGLQTFLFAIGYQPDPPQREPGVVSVRGTSGRVGNGGWRFFGDGFSGGK